MSDGSHPNTSSTKQKVVIENSVRFRYLMASTTRPQFLGDRELPKGWQSIFPVRGLRDSGSRMMMFANARESFSIEMCLYAGLKSKKRRAPCPGGSACVALCGGRVSGIPACLRYLGCTCLRKRLSRSPPRISDCRLAGAYPNER